MATKAAETRQENGRGSGGHWQCPRSSRRSVRSSRLFMPRLRGIRHGHQPCEPLSGGQASGIVLLSRSCRTPVVLVLSSRSAVWDPNSPACRMVRACGTCAVSSTPPGYRMLSDRLTGVEGDVTLDCSGLTFLDSSGLALFVATQRACRARGAKLVIVNPSRCVIRLLELTGSVDPAGCASLTRSAP